VLKGIVFEILRPSYLALFGQNNTIRRRNVATGVVCPTFAQ
jgi:hypothetical protein